MSGFNICTDNYYVVVNKEKKECIITTSKRSIALFIGVSERTVHRYIHKGNEYHDSKCSIYISPEVVKRPSNNPDIGKL